MSCLQKLEELAKKFIELRGEYVEKIASLVAVACFLLGRAKDLSGYPHKDSSERVVTYFSRTLFNAKQKYYVTIRDLLAVGKTLMHFHKYLYGQEFHLRTDPSALTWQLRVRNLEGQHSNTVKASKTPKEAPIPGDIAPRSSSIAKTFNNGQTGQVCG